MKQKVYTILLILSFLMVINKPLIMMSILYMDYVQKVEQGSECNRQERKIAKMRSNGDTYLKALLKRVCKDNKKNRPAVPVITLTVFVKELTNEYLKLNFIEKKYTHISEFIILHHSDQFLLSLFRPPNSSLLS